MKKKIFFIIIIVLLIAVICGGIGYFIWNINQPTAAQLKEGKVTNSQITYAVNLNPKLETGKIASFEYPSSLKMGQPSPPSGPVIEDFYFTMKDVESWILAIDISTTKTGQLTDNSDYVLRKNNPAQYSQTIQTINGQRVVIFSDLSAGGFSEVAFELHGDLLSTISLQGDDTLGTQPLQESFNMVLSSWRWF